MASRIKGIKVEIGGDTTGLDKALKKVNGNISKTASALRDVNRLLKMDPTNATLISQKYKNLQTDIAQTREKLTALKQADIQAKNQLEKGELAQDKYDALQREIIATEQALDKLQNTAGSGSAKLALASAKAGEMGSNLSKAGTAFRGASTAAALFGVAAVKTAADFETAFTGVTKTVSGTDKQLKSIRQEILELAQSSSSSAIDIAAVAEAAGQLGIKTNDIMEFTKTMVMLGDTTNMSADEAATSLAKFANITGMSADKYSRLGSVIVDLGNNFATTEADIVEFATRIAGSAKQVGLSEKEIMALSAALSSVGLEAEAGGTAISTILTRIDKDVALGTSTLNTWAQTAGMSADQFKAAWKKDALSSLQAVITGMSDAKSGGENLNVLLDELGVTNIRTSDTMKRLSSASELLGDAVDTSSSAWAENTAMQKEAEKRYKTVAAQLNQLKETFRELGVNLGDTILPAVTKTANGLKEFTENLSKAPEPIKKATVLMLAMTAATGPLLSGLGKTAAGVSVITGWLSKESTQLTITNNKTKILTATQALANTKFGSTIKMLATNPYVLATAGVIALTAATIKVIEAINKETTAAREAAEARRDKINSIKDESDEAQFYLKRLKELEEVENKSSQQKQLMQTYVDKLNGSIKGLNLTYDAETDKLNQNTDAIYRKIEAQREAALEAAYLKQSKKALEDYTKAQIKTANIQDELKAKKREWNSLSDAEKQTHGALRKEIENLKIQYNDTAKSADLYLQESIKLSNQAQIQSEAFKKILQEAGMSMSKLPQTIVDGIKSGQYVIPQTVEELNALIKFDKAIANAKAQGVQLDIDYAQAIRDGSMTVAEATAAINQNVTSKLGEAKGPAKMKGEETGIAHAAGIESTKGKNKAAAKKAADSAKDGAASVSLENVGINLGLGIARGLSSTIVGKAIKGAAEALVDLAKKAGKKAGIINSPSKLMEDELGYWLGMGVPTGMIKAAPEVSKASQKLVDAAILPAPVAQYTARSLSLATSQQTPIIDYEYMATAMTKAVQNMQFSIILDDRELGRGLRGIGVVFK